MKFFTGKIRAIVLTAALLLAAVVLSFAVYRWGEDATLKKGGCALCHHEFNEETHYGKAYHKDASCVDCHADFSGAMKLAAARAITGGSAVVPHALIKDESCTSSKCHNSLKDKDFNGVNFSHERHSKGAARNGAKILKCASCHTSGDKGGLEVDPGICSACHMKGGGEFLIQVRCGECHVFDGKKPEDKFDHAHFAKTGTACAVCHTEVVKGDGSVDGKVCGKCHMARKIEGNVHQIHTLNRTIECGECHGEIVHGDFGKNQALAPECAKCHGGKHSEVSAFYSGTLLKGVEQFPGAMFLAQVSCEGCHEIGGYMKEMSGASTPLTLIDGIALNCVKCHGEKYGPMLRRWTGEIQAGMDFLKKEAVKAAVLDYSESILAGMKSKITDTLKNLELLYAGIPYHNVLYALIFMNEAKDTLFSVTKSSGEDIPVVLQGVDKNCLSLCHEFTGLPEKTTFKALKMDFPHQYHLDMELACVKCHEVKNHLKRKTGTEPCKECHDLKDFKTETK